MNAIATNTLQLNPDFADQPTIHYFPRESSGGEFFSIWWGHGMTLILSPQQIALLRVAILSSPEANTLAEGEAKP